MPITIIVPTLAIAFPSISVIKNAVCVREQKGYRTWEQFPFYEWKNYAKTLARTRKDIVQLRYTYASLMHAHSNNTVFTDYNATCTRSRHSFHVHFKFSCNIKVILHFSIWTCSAWPLLP